MSVTHTTSARLQTCRSFVTLTLNFPTTPGGYTTRERVDDASGNGVQCKGGTRPVGMKATRWAFVLLDVRLWA